MPPDPGRTTGDGPGRPTRRQVIAWAGGAGIAGAAAGAAVGRVVEPSPAGAGADVAPRLAPAAATVHVRTQPQGLSGRIPAFGHLLGIDLDLAGRPSEADTVAAARRILTGLGGLADAAARGERPTVAEPAALGLLPATLEVTPAVGASLLTASGLKAQRPDALVELPAFATDRLDPAGLRQTDLLVQLGAEDPLRLAAAVQQVGALLGGDARVRWSRPGFRPTAAASQDPATTTRNLMGHRDGTDNPALGSPLWRSTVLVDDPSSWMHHGSFLVARQIRIDLSGWFEHGVAARDRVIGRSTLTGAPLGRRTEKDELDLGLRTADGRLAIDPRAHVRLGNSTNTSGARIYRRSWNYDAGWTDDGERDAGLLFLAWQSDIRRGFLPIQQSLVRGHDLLNGFTTHVGSAVYAAPARGPGERYAGQSLLEV